MSYKNWLRNVTCVDVLPYDQILDFVNGKDGMMVIPAIITAFDCAVDNDRMVEFIYLSVQEGNLPNVRNSSTDIFVDGTNARAILDITNRRNAKKMCRSLAGKNRLIDKFCELVGYGCYAITLNGTIIALAGCYKE